MRILIADAQPKVRFALQVLLQRQPGLEVVGEAIDAESLHERAIATCPDAVLVGWELPGMDMDCLIPSLREICPGIVVIALSGRPEAQQASSEIGVDAFVSKSSPPDQLLGAIARWACELESQRAVESAQECSNKQ